MTTAAIDALEFRRVLGNVPTGVAVITASPEGRGPVGMTVGSFASVSLEPPLVAFMAMRGSVTSALIQEAGSFCANVLSDEQEDECRTFAGKSADKFAGFGWVPASSGSPVLDNVVAWIDCDVETVHAAGDHDIVIGRVRELQPGVPALPLVFLQGAYGRVGLRSFAAWHDDLLQPLRYADVARARIEELSGELGQECILTAAVQQELVLLASSGTPVGQGLTRVGQRMPFVPPLGSLFVAWAGPDAERTWCSRAPEGTAPAETEALSGQLARVRDRGFSVGVGRSVHLSAEELLAGSFSAPRAAVRAAARSWQSLREGIDPEAVDQLPGREARSVAVPVFGPDGQVVLSVGIHRLSTGLGVGELIGRVDRLRGAAADIGRELAAAG